MFSGTNILGFGGLTDEGIDFGINTNDQYIKLAKAMQNAFSPYSYNDWKSIYDSYNSDDIKKSFAYFGDTTEELETNNNDGGHFDDIKRLFEESDSYKKLANSGAGSGLPSAGSSNIDGFVSQYDYGNKHLLMVHH